MTTIVILYAIGFLFHAYCAFIELKHCDKIGMHVSLFDHVKATFLLIIWPWIPLSILFDFYRMKLAYYAESQSSDS